jgi:hypothetical protein
MKDDLLGTFVTIATAIVGLAALAVFLNKSGTGVNALKTTFSGLAQDITAATAPVTGASYSPSMNIL